MSDVEAIREQVRAAQSQLEELNARLRLAEEQAQASRHPQQLSDEASPVNAPADHVGDTAHDVVAAPPSLGQHDVQSAPLSGLLIQDLQAAADQHTYDVPATTTQEQDPLTPLPASSEPIEYPLTHDLVTLEVRQIWPGLSEIKAIVESHALAQGWTSTTKKRDRTRICMGCRSTPTCPYHLRAETCPEGARISSYKPGHTCVGQEDVRKRKQVSYMRFLNHEIPRLMPDVNIDTPVSDIQDAIYREHGKKIAPSQVHKFKATLPRVNGRRAKRKGGQTCKRCHRPGHNIATCIGEEAQGPDVVQYEVPNIAID